MRKIFTCLFSSGLLLTGFVAAGTIYTSIQNGVWRDPTTWNPNGVPDVDQAAHYVVVIDHAVTTSASLTLNGNGSITINFTGSLDVAGNFVDRSGNFSMASGSSLNATNVAIKPSHGGSGIAVLSGYIESSSNIDVDRDITGVPTLVVGSDLKLIL